ncbi:MAG: threonine synthase, partial [Duncaniella sp.]|nr:threonine synthase [Duncaniella sp.]
DVYKRQVGNPSNFSRILDLYNGDREAISRDMKGYALSDERIISAMRNVYSRHGYLMDPHGATAYEALRENLAPGEKGIFLATAHPAKFPQAVKAATGIQPENVIPTTTGNPDIHHDTPRITPSLLALKKVLLSTL